MNITDHTEAHILTAEVRGVPVVAFPRPLPQRVTGAELSNIIVTALQRNHPDLIHPDFQRQ